MEQKVPVANNTEMPIFVAGLMIPPGETRHFDKDQVPQHLLSAEAEPEQEVPADPFETLLSHKVDDVVAALPAMSVEEIEKLGEMEQVSKKPRTTLLSAIAEELLNRAAKTQLQQAIEGLPNLTDEELAALDGAEKAKGESANAELRAAIDAEIEKRKE